MRRPFGPVELEFEIRIMCCLPFAASPPPPVRLNRIVTVALAQRHCLWSRGQHDREDRRHRVRSVRSLSAEQDGYDLENQANTLTSSMCKQDESLLGVSDSHRTLLTSYQKCSTHHYFTDSDADCNRTAGQTSSSTNARNVFSVNVRNSRTTPTGPT